MDTQISARPGTTFLCHLTPVRLRAWERLKRASVRGDFRMVKKAAKLLR